MLIQLCKVEELLCKAINFSTSRLSIATIEELLKPLIFSIHLPKLVSQVSYAIMILFLVSVTDVRALAASKDDCRARILMLKDVCIRQHLFASTFTIATLELYLSEKIPCDAVDLIEL